MRSVILAALLAASLVAAVVGLFLLRAGPTRTLLPAPGKVPQDPGGQGTEQGTGLAGKNGKGGGATHGTQPERPVPVDPGPTARGGRDPGGKRLPLEHGEATLSLLIERVPGSPLSGGTISLLQGRRERRQTLDTSGHTVFERIPGGDYGLLLECTDGERFESARPVSLTPGEVRELRLQTGDGRLGIAGRILDVGGQPLGGVLVSARRDLSTALEGELLPVGDASLQATSGLDGRYALRGLDAVDYLVRVEPPGGLPPATRTARGGTSALDFVLGASRALEVRGSVLARGGEPLEGATVLGSGAEEVSVASGEDGRYVLSAALRPDQTALAIVARKEGYRESRFHVRLEDVGAASTWDLDLVLDPLGAHGAIVGSVKDLDGTPVPGILVQVFSPSLGMRHETRTERSGAFELRDVEVAGDYRLTIFPEKGYRDFSQSPIEVTADGASVEVVLEPLRSAALRGQLVDPTGAPAAGLTLWARSLRAMARSVPVTSSADGSFETPDAPEGDLVLETRTEPKLTVRGLKVDPDATGEAGAPPVTVVVDWGTLRVEGHVLDEAGAPLGGAAVTMTWAQSANGQQSSSYRATVTDISGRFVFAELGGGERKVTASTPHHTPTQLSVDPATPGAVELRLQPRPTRKPEVEQERD